MNNLRIRVAVGMVGCCESDEEWVGEAHVYFVHSCSLK